MEVRAATKAAMEAEQVATDTRAKATTRDKAVRTTDTKTQEIQEGSTLDMEEVTHNMVVVVVAINPMATAAEILNQEEAVVVAELPGSTPTT